MTTLRLTLVTDDANETDVHVELAEGCTVGELLASLPVEAPRSWYLGGQRLDATDTLVEESDIVDGAILTTVRERDAGARSGQFLVTIAGPDTGAWIELGPDPVSVGRSAAADFTVADPYLSREELTVVIVDDLVVLTPNKSRNGVMVAEHRLAGQAQIGFDAIGSTYIRAGTGPPRPRCRASSNTPYPRERMLPGTGGRRSPTSSRWSQRSASPC